MEAVLKDIFISENPFADSHEADSLTFNCCDFRFRQQAHDFLSGEKSDPFVFPGGIMLFVGGRHGHPDMKEGALYWTKTIVQLHRLKEIKLVIHKHCGAYAAAPALKGKTADEIYAQQLFDVKEVRDLLQQEMPEAKIFAYFMQPTEQKDGVVFSEIQFVD